MRREAKALAALGVCLAATACGQASVTAPAGTHEPRAGLYRAVLSGRRGPAAVAAVIWVELPSGRFRESLDGGPPGLRIHTLTVFDGRNARVVSHFRHLPASILGFRGSSGFVSQLAAGPDVTLIRRFLSGRRPPAGVTLTATHAQGHLVLRATAPGLEYHVLLYRHAGNAPPGLFRLPPGRPRLAETQIDLAHPRRHTGAFWLGPAVLGRMATGGVSDGHGTSSVSYPGVDVEQAPPFFKDCPCRPIRLADGGGARMLVLPLDRRGFYSFSYTTRNGGGMEAFQATPNFGAPPGRWAVLVQTSTSTIMLTGPAVTKSNAVALARMLRPL